LHPKGPRVVPERADSAPERAEVPTHSMRIAALETSEGVGGGQEAAPKLPHVSLGRLEASIGVLERDMNVKRLLHDLESHRETRKHGT